MEEVQNDLETGEMHSEDDRVLVDKNRKRTVKTPAQVEALEKFYNEHKYPTEAMKTQLADSIGLTEKQVSGWFCHRRLKDKKLMNVDNCVAGKQDRSSGVIQDRGSGHRQDSCGSTKLGDDRNFDTREVESGRLILPENYTAEFHHELGGRYSANYNQTDGASSGSSSSFRNLSIQRSENHFDMVTSRHVAPKKFPMDVLGAKPRSGPSGYLKVKRPVENSAVTAVKRQLGEQFREDGPPLGVDFDPLPPGAFESSMPNQIDETCHTEETASPASPDDSQIHKAPKFGKGCEYNSSMTSLNSKMDRTSLNAPQGTDIPDYYGLQKPKKNSSLPNNGAYHSWRSPEASARDVPGGENRDHYGTRYRLGVEDMRMSSVLNSCQQPFRGKFGADQGSSFRKFNEVSRKHLKGENIENVSSISAIKGSENQHALDKMQPGPTPKDGKTYGERKMTNENQASKRTWDGYSWQPPQKKPSMADDQPVAFRPIRSAADMRSSSSNEEMSAETSSST